MTKLTGILWLLVGLLCASQTASALFCQECTSDCGKCFDPCTTGSGNEKGIWDKGNKAPCNQGQRDNAYQNLPILNGVYCYNNGSGLCKAFAGRFEFYFNTFTDKFIGPVGKSEFVDEYGYHERVPVSYSIDGAINYADRSINWAAKYAESHIGAAGLQLLNSYNFNWCDFVESNYWPYRSAIRHYNETEKLMYHIYFFNRQTCIYIRDLKKGEFFNSRFMYKSNLKIDLDFNPTIFAMEDNQVQDKSSRIRLVKHKREWWYEVKFSVARENNATLHVEHDMGKGCKLCERPIIMTRDAYGDKSGLCISDYYNLQQGSKKELNKIGCGMDQIEVADHTYVASISEELSRRFTYEVTVHNIPRYWPLTMNFYGVPDSTTDWEKLQDNGIAFSASTSMPVEGSYTEVDVIAMYVKYKISNELGDGDRLDNYPIPYLSRYRAKYENNNWLSSYNSESRALKEVRVDYLNYVDDIAYLYSCPSILVIFGPLYAQYKADIFGIESINKTAQVDSIIKLDMWELPSAFFAMPTTNVIWVYYRTNFVAQLQYQCKGNGLLITAQQVDGKYYQRYGQDLPPRSIFPGANLHSMYKYTTDRSEETFFSDLKLFGKAYNETNHSAPNPSKYPFVENPIPGPQTPPDNTWIYVLIGVALLLIVMMCLICLLTLRRRRRHRDRLKSMVTTRSGLTNMSSASPTIRDPLPSNRSGIGSHGTVRSSNISGGGGGSRASGRTVRSSVSQAKSRPPSTIRSGTVSSNNLSRSSGGVQSTRSPLKKASSSTRTIRSKNSAVQPSKS